MVRPKVPLISRRKTYQVALDIIDRDGVDALTSRVVGEALDVNGASLYHHFSGMGEILAGAAQYAFDKVVTPQSEDDHWQDWLITNTHYTREALLSHPALIPYMLRRMPLRIGEREVNTTVQRLEDEGVPLGAIVPLMESLELVGIMSALLETIETRESTDELIDGESLGRAVTSQELFDDVCAVVINDVLAAIDRKQQT